MEEYLNKEVRVKNKYNKSGNGIVIKEGGRYYFLSNNIGFDGMYPHSIESKYGKKYNYCRAITLDIDEAYGVTRVREIKLINEEFKFIS